MSSYVRQIQTTLKNAGFYEGEIDGIAGKMTVAAVNRAMRVGELTQEEVRVVNEQSTSSPMVVEPSTLDVSDTPISNSGFKLGQRSLKNLEGVNPDLIKVVKRAIEITQVDFSVIEGLRTVERQRELVRKGASKTMNSRHLTGHAIDIAPIIDGKISWDFNHYYPLASAMAKAATELGVQVRWGGAWEVITGKSTSPIEWVKSYKTRGGRFLDGPHFELV